jgi:hypothetical protein
MQGSIGAWASLPQWILRARWAILSTEIEQVGKQGIFSVNRDSARKSESSQHGGIVAAQEKLWWFKRHSTCPIRIPQDQAGTSEAFNAKYH